MQKGMKVTNNNVGASSAPGSEHATAESTSIG